METRPGGGASRAVSRKLCPGGRGGRHFRGPSGNMAEACNAGFTVDMKKLPILQETIEVCEALELNPYEIASGGCAVLAADNGNDIVWGLGPSAVFVGKVTKGRTGSS